jgi:exosortase A
MIAQPQRASLLILAITSIAYVLLYGSTWLDMERVWRSSATYNHCYLIIPIVLFFFYRSKASAPLSLSHNSRLWLPALALLFMQFIWLFGYAADIALLMHMAAVITLQALIWLVLGTTNSYRHRFAILYLLFLIPFGEELSPFLQNITADHTVMLLQAVNIPVYRDGLYLATPVGLFEVAEACSGLRFLIAALAISVLFAYLHYNRIWKQLCFVIFMAILSVLANGVRAFMLVYIGEKTQMRYGFGDDHFVYGWLFFGLVLMAGFWLGARFADPVHALVPTKKQQFSLRPLSAGMVVAMCAVLSTLAYRLSLHVMTAPASAAVISLPIAANVPDNSNWGVHFEHSLAYNHVQDSNGIEYYVARFGNKQQDGELVNWQNVLFDKRRWQVQQRTVENGYALLQLKNLANEYRTVLYWYQVGQHSSSDELTTKLLQALSYLQNDHSMAHLYALSLAGPASKHKLAMLQRAAALVASPDQNPDISGDRHD